MNIPHISDLGQTLHPSTAPRITAVLVSLLVIGYYAFRRSKRLNFPLVGNPKDADFRQALMEGVAKYPNTPFIIPYDPQVLVAPISTINEYKYYTREVASFAKFVKSVFHAEFSHVGELEDGALISTIKNDVSRQLAETLGIFLKEVVHGFDSCFGPSKDWTARKLYPSVAKIVALMSGRVFVGLPLSRDERLVDASIYFTFQVTSVADRLQKMPRWYPKFVKSFYKEVKDIKKFKEQYTETIRPIVEAHLAKEGNEKLYSDEGDERGKFVAHFLNRMPQEKLGNMQYIINQLLGLSFASIHTTTSTATQIIFDLASYREYIPLLVDEIKEVMTEDGCETTDDGALMLRKISLPKLLKLDSFMKESQRVSPLSLVSLGRVATSDLTLSTGHLIPKGTHLVYPAWEVYNKSTALYVDGHTKPLNQFDGLRYYNLRSLPGYENSHHFVSNSPESLHFGYGNQSCPGRFLANDEIKVILIQLLLNWDFRFLDDVKMEGGAWRRPQNIFTEFDCRSDMNVYLAFRRKKV